MQVFNKVLAGALLVAISIAKIALAEINLEVGGFDLIRLTLEGSYKTTYGIGNNESNFRIEEFKNTGRFYSTYEIVLSMMRENENGSEYGAVLKITPTLDKRYIIDFASADATGLTTSAPAYEGEDRIIGVVDQYSSHVPLGADLYLNPGSGQNPITLGSEFKIWSEVPHGSTPEERDEITFKDLREMGVAGSVTGGQIELEKPLIQAAYLVFKTRGENRAVTSEIGRVSSVSSKLRIDASDISYGSGGIGGYWNYYANLKGDQNITFTDGSLKDSKDKAKFISKPGSWSSLNSKDKSSLSTNLLVELADNLMLGFSYTANQGDLNSERFASDMRNYKDVVAAGLTYENVSDNIHFIASAVGEFGTHENSDFNNLKSYNVGAIARFFSDAFALAASYGNFGNSGLKTALGNNNNSEYWTLGGAYENGPTAFSVSYMQSKAAQEDIYGGVAELSNLVLSAEYRTSKGLTPFVEASLFNTDDITVDPADTGNKMPDTNSGSVLLIGTKLAF